MYRTQRNGRRIVARVGVVAGLCAGLSGVAAWVLAQWTLQTQLAAFAADPQGNATFHDYTNVDRTYELVYVLTAPVAVALALAACSVAAYIASERAQSQRVGVWTAWVAALVGGSIWTLTTLVVSLSTPAPDMTAHLFPCETFVAVVGVSLLTGLAPLSAWLSWLQWRWE